MKEQLPAVDGNIKVFEVTTLEDDSKLLWKMMESRPDYVKY